MSTRSTNSNAAENSSHGSRGRPLGARTTRIDLAVAMDKDEYNMTTCEALLASGQVHNRSKLYTLVQSLNMDLQKWSKFSSPFSFLVSQLPTLLFLSFFSLLTSESSLFSIHCSRFSSQSLIWNIESNIRYRIWSIIFSPSPFSSSSLVSLPNYQSCTSSLLSLSPLSSLHPVVTKLRRSFYISRSSDKLWEARCKARKHFPEARCPFRIVATSNNSTGRGKYKITQVITNFYHLAFRICLTPKR